MSHLSADKTAVNRTNLTLRQDVLKQPPARIEKSLRIQLLLYELRLGHSSADSWLLWALWFSAPGCRAQWLIVSWGWMLRPLKSCALLGVFELIPLSRFCPNFAGFLQAQSHVFIPLLISGCVSNGLKPFLFSSLLPLWAGSLNPIIHEQTVGLLFQSPKSDYSA